MSGRRLAFGSGLTVAILGALVYWLAGDAPDAGPIGGSPSPPSRGTRRTPEKPPVVRVLHDERTGISIHCDLPDDMFHPGWIADGSFRAYPVPDFRVAHVHELITACLRRYPDALLQRTLRKVYVLGHLYRTSGANFGGTYGEGKLYLVDDLLDWNRSGMFVMSAFHHELASVLLVGHPNALNRTAWKRANPPGFAYGSGGVREIRQGRALSGWQDRFLARGFRNQYATTSLENDVNELAEALMLHPEHLLRLGRYRPRLQQKVDELIAFYGRLHPDLDADWFRTQTDVFVSPRGQVPAGTRHYRQAVAFYSRVIEKDPTDPGAWWSRAHAREEWARYLMSGGSRGRKLLVQAIGDYSRSLEANPENASTRSRRGLARLRLAEDRVGRDRDARALLRDALEDLESAQAGNPALADSLERHIDRCRAVIARAER